MGARLVAAALNPQWACLSDQARLVLVTMAHTALDRTQGDQERGLYWGGHEHIGLILTGTTPDPGTREHQALKRRIIRVVNELLDAGAIERVKAAHRGQRAEYRVTCDLYGQDVLPLAAGR